MAQARAEKPNRLGVRALRVVIVASLILPGVLAAATAVQDWRQLHAGARQHVQTTAALLREHALKVFQTHEIVLDRVDERIRGLSWEEIDRSTELHEDLKRYTIGLDHVSSLLLVRPDGVLSNNTRSFPLPQPVNVADRDYYLVPRSGAAGLYIGERFEGRVSGQPIINVSRRRSSLSGEFDGVIAIAVFIDYFDRFYRASKATPETSIALVRADGTVFVRQPAGTSGATQLSARSGILSAAQKAPTGVFETISELDGLWRLHGYEKIGVFPVYVSYGVSLQALRADWIKNVASYLVFAVISSLGLASLAFVALRQVQREQRAVIRWQSEVRERQTAEELYRNLYNRAPVPQQSLDAAGVILNVSDTWLQLLGYERDDVVGRPFSSFVAPEYRAQFEEERTRLMQTGSVRDVSFDVIRRSGERVPVLWSGAVERDSDGVFVKTFGALVDVTERRRAEQQLVHYQKMEAIGQLVAGVGHDFNNLLQAVGGCLRVIERRVSDPAVKSFIEAGQQAVARGAKLTQQLMAFARREALRPEPLDIPAQVLTSAELLSQALRADIEVTLDLERGLWPVLVDPTQFEVALINIAVNARDAMPEGGRFALSGRNLTLTPGTRADGLSGDFVELTMVDTGTGMARDVLERVFDPFYTTKERGKGTGLGLSQVYGFARQSGGAVDIESAPGTGTRVRLILPRSRELPVFRAQQLGTKVSLTGTRLLLVEDDPIVATSVGAVLEDLGCTVTSAATGEAALTQLRAGQFDVLFSDIVMPGGMSGVQLAQMAQRLRPDLPIVLTTGYSEERVGLEHVRVLHKPYRMEALADVLGAALSGRRSAV